MTGPRHRSHQHHDRGDRTHADQEPQLPRRRRCRCSDGDAATCRRCCTLPLRPLHSTTTRQPGGQAHSALVLQSGALVDGPARAAGPPAGGTTCTMSRKARWLAHAVTLRSTRAQPHGGRASGHSLRGDAASAADVDRAAAGLTARAGDAARGLDGVEAAGFVAAAAIAEAAWRRASVAAERPDGDKGAAHPHTHQGQGQRRLVVPRRPLRGHRWSRKTRAQTPAAQRLSPAPAGPR